MDRETLERHLIEAQSHVDTGERSIARQRFIIDELRRDGHPIEQAEQLLKNFLDLQQSHIKDFEHIRAELRKKEGEDNAEPQKEVSARDEPATAEAANTTAGRRPDRTRVAKYWREKAEEARALASEMSDRGSKGTLEKIGILYDQMADRAERRDASTKPSSK